MADQTIDKLQIEINAKSNASSAGIDKMAQSIQRLKSAIGGGTDKLNGISDSLFRLNVALKGGKDAASGANSLYTSIKKLQNLKVDNLAGISQAIHNLKSAAGSGGDRLSGMATSLESLATGLDKIKGKTSGLTAIANAFKSLNSVDLSKISQQLTDFQDKAKGFADIGSGLDSIRDFGKGMTSLAKSFDKIKKLDMKAVSKAIDDIVTAVKPLNDEMIRAGAGLSNFATGLKYFASALKAAKKANNQVENYTKTSKGGFAGLSSIINISKIGASIYAVKQLTDVIGNSIKSVNSYIEDMNLFTVSMGKFAGEARNFAMSMQQVLGINAGEAMRNMGFFQQLSASFGVASDKAYILSKNMTQLAYDYSSFLNISVEDAFQKLRSGLVGEIEPMRAIGKDLSVARLQLELTNMGIKANVNSLSQADKSLLRYIVTMKQSTMEMGDMARTIMSPANALRVLQSQLQITSRNIGSIFIPALTSILPYAIAVVKIIGELAARLAALAGFEMPEFSVPDTNFSGVSNDLGNIADEAENAKKQMSLLIGGFDELNKVESQSSSKDQGDIGNILGGIDLPTYDAMSGNFDNEVDKIVSKMMEALRKIKDTLMNLGLSEVIDNFKNFFNDLSNQIAQYDFATAIKNALLNGFELAMSLIIAAQKLIFPIAIALDIPGIVYESINTISSLFKMLNDAVQSVTPGLQSFVQIGLVPIAKWLGEKIKSSLILLQDEIKKIGSWFQSTTSVFTDFGTELGKLVASVWEFIEPIADPIWEGFKTILSQIIDSVLSITKKFTELVTQVIKTVSAFGEYSDKVAVLKVIQEAFIKSINAVKVAFEIAIDIIKALITGVIDGLTAFLKFLEGVFTQNWELAWEGIKDYFQASWNMISDIFTTMWNNIFKDAWNQYTSTLKNDWSFFWNSLSENFKIVWTGIKNIFTFIIEYISEKINKMIDDITTAIELVKDLLGLSKKEDFKVGGNNKFSGYSGGRNSSSEKFAPSPALLAGGAVLRKPTLNIAGEYPGANSNPEIVAPQDTIYETVVSANGKLVEAMYQMSQMIVQAFTQGQNVSIQIDGKEIGKVSAQYIKEEERLTGRNPAMI